MDNNEHYSPISFCTFYQGDYFNMGQFFCSRVKTTTRPVFTVSTEPAVDTTPCKLTQSNESLAAHLAESVNLNSTISTSEVTDRSLVGSLVDALPPQVGLNVSMHRAHRMDRYYETPVDLSSTSTAPSASGGTSPPLPGETQSDSHLPGGGKSRKTHKHSQQRHGAGGAPQYITQQPGTHSGLIGDRTRELDYSMMTHQRTPMSLIYHGDMYSSNNHVLNNNSIEHQQHTQHTRMYY